MPRPHRWNLIRFAASGIAVLLAAPAPAGDHDEHENARRAVERGEALPLADILRLVGDQLGGDVTRVSFEREHGRWVYEFKVVEPGGRLVEVYVEAASGRVLEREAD